MELSRAGGGRGRSRDGLAIGRLPIGPPVGPCRERDQAGGHPPATHPRGQPRLGRLARGVEVGRLRPGGGQRRPQRRPGDRGPGERAPDVSPQVLVVAGQQPLEAARDPVGAVPQDAGQLVAGSGLPRRPGCGIRHWHLPSRGRTRRGPARTAPLPAGSG